MPRTGAFAAMGIWYQFEAPPDACAPVLAPGRAMSRYQFPSLVPVQTKGTSCCCSQYLWPGPLARFLVASVPAATAAGTFGLDLWLVPWDTTHGGFLFQEGKNTSYGLKGA